MSPEKQELIELLEEVNRMLNERVKRNAKEAPLQEVIKRSVQKKVTLPEIAKISGAKYSTVANYASKAGWTRNGRMTLLSEFQATIIIEAMKQGAKANHSNNLLSSIEGVETSQSRVLRLQILNKQMQEIYNAEIDDLRAENKGLIAENEELKAENKQIEDKAEMLAETLDESKLWFSVKRIMELNKELGEIPWKPLKDLSKKMGYEIKKAYDANYGLVNLYHRDVWESLYYAVVFREEDMYIPNSIPIFGGQY